MAVISFVLCTPPRDTAGQERFETLTAQYYRRAQVTCCTAVIVKRQRVPSLNVHVLPQGIMLVYDITQEQTYSNVSKWLRNIEEVR